MNQQEFVDVIESIDENAWRDLAFDLFSGLCSHRNKAYLALKELGYEVDSVDSYGGDWPGEEYWGVFSVTKDDVVTHFKLNGWYASFAGAEMESGPMGFFEVKKVPVQTYEWEPA